jgi:hypothetical protein
MLVSSLQMTLVSLELDERAKRRHGGDGVGTSFLYGLFLNNHRIKKCSHEKRASAYSISFFGCYIMGGSRRLGATAEDVGESRTWV